ncbi:hypothetical protein GEMRC1_013151 [Eukaryota sp. GEM-RC1]
MVIDFPEEVAREFKRLMGRPFSQNDTSLFKRFPYPIQEDNTNGGVIAVLDGQFFSPQVLSSIILDRIKIRAEELRDLMKGAYDTVITVPAYFNDSQKNATEQAGILAGLNVVRILEEPIAAAMAYFHSFPELGTVSNIFLVFDLGGGTFDISLIKAGNDLHTVIDTDGDADLGGSDFDELLVEFCLETAVRQFGKQIRNNNQFKTRLRIKCEICKKNLFTMIDSFSK